MRGSRHRSPARRSAHSAVASRPLCAPPRPLPGIPPAWQAKPAQQQPNTPTPRRSSASSPSSRACRRSSSPGKSMRCGTAGAGAARPGLPAAGRRLRRGLRRMPVRPDHQAAEDPAADEPGAAARAQEADHPRRPHGRAIREAALRRYRDARRRHAAELSRRSGEPPGVHRRSARRRTRSCCCAATSARRSR